jgi:cytochrome b
MTPHRLMIWDPVLRFLHWSFASCFVMNYWILEQGDFWHRCVGYLLLLLVIARLIWGFTGPDNAKFSVCIFQKSCWQAHFEQLKRRQLHPHEGHNPFGYLWLYVTLGLFIALATTGFLLEEVDYFFGSDRLELIHGTFANTLFALACVHVLAVILVQWWGSISLIKPMITGKRET